MIYPIGTEFHTFESEWHMGEGYRNLDRPMYGKVIGFDPDNERPYDVFWHYIDGDDFHSTYTEQHIIKVVIRCECIIKYPTPLLPDNLFII
jgi:hypothetical protein